MKKTILIAVSVALLVPTAPAGATRVVELGRDASGDAPPALDLIYLAVGAAKDTLEVRLGIAGMLPATGGYPALPGIEWIFDVGSRTFIAEAVAGTPGPRFYLFEKKGEDYVQLDSPTGTYNFADGYASILIPFEDIGASSGTKISGTGKKGTEDVDAHVHVGPYSHYADKFATKKDYVIP